MWKKGVLQSLGIVVHTTNNNLVVRNISSFLNNGLSYSSIFALSSVVLLVEVVFKGSDLGSAAKTFPSEPLSSGRKTEMISDLCNVRIGLLHLLPVPDLTVKSSDPVPVHSSGSVVELQWW